MLYEVITVADLHGAREEVVTALVRSADSAQRLRADGLAVLQSDLDGKLPVIRAREVYYFAPPPARPA